MSTVLLIIHVMIALALIGVVLLQRSEGGALGIGGGGGGGFMTGRGAANLLTRVTAGLAAAFFATSLILSIVATRTEAPRSILDAPAGAQPGKETKPSQLPQIDLNMPSAPTEPPKGDAPRVPQSK
jgi:preprotein translocase subunit SecG